MEVFERVVCGVDESPESRAAGRLAARLVEPDGALVLVAGHGTGRVEGVPIGSVLVVR